MKQRPSRIDAGRWILTSALLAGPIRLGLRVLLARILQPVAFGLLSLANSTAISFCGIAGLGLDTAINRYTAENYRRDTPLGRSHAIVILMMTLVASSLFLIVAAWLLPYWGHRIFPNSTPTSTIYLCLWLAWLNIIVTYGANLLNGLQLFREIAVTVFAQTVVTMSGALAGGYFHGVNGAVYGYLFGSVFCIAYYLWILWKFDPQLFHWRGTLQGKDVTGILAFSLPIWLGTLAFGPVMTLAMSFLDQQPGGARELGIFSTANPIRMLLGVLPGIVGPIIGPAIIEEGGKHGQSEVYEKLLKDSLSATSFLTLPILVALLGMRKFIFMVYGSAYDGASDIFIPLVISAGISFIVSPAQYAMLAKNKIWPLQGLAVLNSVLLLSLAYWWVPGNLGLGLGYAVLGAEFLTAIGMQEYCALTGLIPNSLRRPFYGYMGVMLGIVLGFYLAPDIVEQLVSLPAAAALAVVIIRMHPDIVNWLERAAPERFKPAIRRVAALVMRRRSV
jgi:O-antigen/teichoic acid export membrane protein